MTDLWDAPRPASFCLGYALVFNHLTALVMAMARTDRIVTLLRRNFY